MKIIEAYLLKNSLLLMSAVLGLFLLIQTVLIGMDELRLVGTHHYDIWQLGWYLLLNIPQSFYQYFSSASLVGMVLALGVMNQQNEILIMRASGMSVLSIARSLCKFILILVLLATLVGEILAPVSCRMAEQCKATALARNSLLRQADDLWLRQAENFIHVRFAKNAKPSDITVYQVRHGHLQSILKATGLQVLSNGWRLLHVQKSRLSPSHITQQRLAQLFLPVRISPTFIRRAKQGPEDMTLWQLWRLMRYYHANQQQQQAGLNLVFWQRLLRPLSTLAMLLLAVPFVCMQRRQRNQGVQIILAIAVGAFFQVANRLFGPVTSYLQLSPFIAAILPILILLAIAACLVAWQYWHNRIVRPL